MRVSCTIFVFFFFNDTATTEIYTLSLHDALPILVRVVAPARGDDRVGPDRAGLLGRDLGVGVGHGEDNRLVRHRADHLGRRSEEHTSELQSRQYLVCRLLLEKKKKK